MNRHISVGLLSLIALLSGAALAEDAKPEWTLKGSRIIGCCCAAPCPCRINKPPYHCHGCDYTTAVHIDEGSLGKVDFAGMTWVICGRGFGQDKETLWSYVYVSDKATDEQVAALKAMFDDDVKKAGPKAPYLVGKMLGMRKVPVTYEISKDKREYGVVIPGVLEFRTRSIILPGHTEPVTSTGIFDDFGDRFIHADCLVHKYNDAETKYSWDLSGRQANQADFTLTSTQAEKGGIGWSCWSAHADFGSKDPYEEKTGDDKK